MNKDKITYSLNGQIKGRKEFDAILKDIENLEELPNKYMERHITLIPDNMTKGRGGMEYIILDGDNLIHIPGKETSVDPRGLRTFNVKEGRLIERTEKP